MAAPDRPEGTLALWSRLFSRPSPEDVRSSPPMRNVDPVVMAPVTLEEVTAALAETEDSTAPGYAGRRFGDLKSLGTEKLAWVVNACIWHLWRE